MKVFFLHSARGLFHCSKHTAWGLLQVDVEVARGILTRVLGSGDQAEEDEEGQEAAQGGAGRDPDQPSDEEGSSPRASTYALPPVCTYQHIRLFEYAAWSSVCTLTASQ